MASLKNKVQKVEGVEDAVATKSNSVEAPEITKMTKVNFEKRPTLKAYFHMHAKGIFAKATFTEKKKDDKDVYGVMFPYREYKDKNEEEQKFEYVHAIDAETRQIIIDNLLATFTKLFKDEFNVEKDVYEKNGVQVKWPMEKNFFTGQIGNASVTVLNHPMFIGNMELHEKDGKYFVVYPTDSYQDKTTKEWKKVTTCGPANKEINVAITEAAVKAYQELK